MRSHKAAQLGAVMVRAHEQLALVLVAAGVAGCRLGGGCQPLEVELVGIPFSVHLRHYVLVIVIPKIEQNKNF